MVGLSSCGLRLAACVVAPLDLVSRPPLRLRSAHQQAIKLCSRRRPRQPTDGLRGRVGCHHRPLLPHPPYGNRCKAPAVAAQPPIATTVSHHGALRSAAALADALAAAPATAAPGAAWPPSGSASAAAPGAAWPPPGSASQCRRFGPRQCRRSGNRRVVLRSGAHAVLPRRRRRQRQPNVGRRAAASRGPDRRPRPTRSSSPSGRKDARRKS